MSASPGMIVMHRQPITSPNDVVSRVAYYAEILPWPKQVPEEVYVDDVVRTLLTSPTTRKEIGFYSMLLPYPVLLLHEGTLSSEKGLLVLPHCEDDIPEGKYHGRLFVRLSNADTRMDHAGRIVTPIGPEDQLEIGLMDVSLVTRSFAKRPPRKRLLRRLMDAAEDIITRFNQL